MFKALCLVIQRSSFFKFKFIYFNWRVITLQYCIGLPYINMNLAQVYTSLFKASIFPVWSNILNTVVNKSTGK